MDITTLTLGDAEDIEDISGRSFDVIAETLESGSMPPIKVMIALAYVFKRKTDPDVTIESIRSMPIEQLMDMMGGDDVDPESPELAAPAPSSTPS